MTHTLEQLRSGALHGITRLNLRGGLQQFPDEIFTLADSLEILDLSDNQLTSLPDTLPRLTKLRAIFCSGNPFTTLPAVLGQCPSLSMIGFKSCRIDTVPAAALPAGLRWLILTDNRIQQLPDALGNCHQLEKLMLAGNQLHSLPASLAQCRQLALLRIAANRFDRLPDCLLSLPKLAWLACAGNPFSEPAAATTAATSLAEIDWASLQLGAVLGQGASGIIHAAQLADGRDVAVKVFRGDVTSDGLPACELAAALHAGPHPGLMPLLGRLRAHPEGLAGLVMPRLADGYQALAGPPSLQSCSRDVYAPGFAVTLPQLLATAGCVAGAMAHLHQRGITHGDLYAHNTLVHASLPPLLSDFGAASRYVPDGPHAGWLQALDVCAFGYLLGELLAACPQAANRPGLAALAAACTQADSHLRPGFGQIVAQLSAHGAALPA